MADNSYYNNGMNGKRKKYYEWLFLVAAACDGVVGAVLIFFGATLYSLLDMDLPPHPGYLSFIGAFLLVIGSAYFFVYSGIKHRNVFNRDLIKVGALYKGSYLAVMFYYLLAGMLPHPVFACLFGVVDVIFLVLFVECLNYTGKSFRRDPVLRA